MWQIERVEDCCYETEEFDAFEEAKKRFREIISSNYKVEFVDVECIIDEYCKEFYQGVAPKAIAWLKTVLTSFSQNPNYALTAPQMQEDVAWEDENVSIRCENKVLYVRKKAEDDYCSDYDGYKFLIVEMDVLDMNDEDKEYFFYVSDKQGLEINVILSKKDD